VSGCYEQFSNLKKLSTECSQLIFATHWYGFIPTASSGRLLALSQVASNLEAHSIDLYKGREAVTHLIKESKGSAQIDLSLKSIFDFVSSIMTSVATDDKAIWIICEGSTDKRYIEHYLNRDLDESYNIYLCPVGGIGDVKRIIEMLDAPFQSIKSEIKGLVIGLTDTDSQLVEITKPKHDNLIGLRLIYTEKDNNTHLVPSDGNPRSPETSIEDSLNPELFVKSLRFVRDTYYKYMLPWITSETEPDKNANCSYNAIDLTTSQRQELNQFYSLEGVKYYLALEYVKQCNLSEHNTPNIFHEMIDIIKKNN